MLLKIPSKNFPNKEVDVSVLVNHLREFFETKNYKVDFQKGAAGAIILDANQSTTIRDWLGLSLRITLRLNTGSEVTRIWIGNQKWVDKIIVAFIGIVLWLLTITYYKPSCASYYIRNNSSNIPLLIIIFVGLLIILPTIGAYLQLKITQDVWNMIENHAALEHGSNS
ncbi:hypothetical protein GTQ43_06395 [Nostoc sp. KVJ3]|uniref:hypothetical protein n=1 Tax=Nostoc sp. KVJ3 TaxID=457945 RepID=UPI002237E8E5|nr:hypothetical protein [Nostoc sp. KVJ3]MCW5313449.1 hypothetical protein [Nostoc sp. KVJ3]